MWWWLLLDVLLCWRVRNESSWPKWYIDQVCNDEGKRIQKVKVRLCRSKESLVTVGKLRYTVSRTNLMIDMNMRQILEQRKIDTRIPMELTTRAPAKARQSKNQGPSWSRAHMSGLNVCILYRKRQYMTKKVANDINCRIRPAKKVWRNNKS